MEITDPNVLHAVGKMLEMQRHAFEDGAMGAMHAARRRERRRQNRQLLGLGGTVGRERLTADEKRARRKERERRRRSYGGRYGTGRYGYSHGYRSMRPTYNRDRPREGTLRDSTFEDALARFKRTHEARPVGLHNFERAFNGARPV